MRKYRGSEKEVGNSSRKRVRVSREAGNSRVNFPAPTSAVVSNTQALFGYRRQFQSNSFNCRQVSRSSGRCWILDDQRPLNIKYECRFVVPFEKTFSFCTPFRSPLEHRLIKVPVYSATFHFELNVDAARGEDDFINRKGTKNV